MVCDLDGTLLDSDKALADAFVALGVARHAVTYGHVLEVECRRLGLSLESYLDAYDTTSAQPFPGVEELLGELPRWAVCSNKHGSSGRAELGRLGWEPVTAWFADAFAGAKALTPMLNALGVDPVDALFVGDTEHDRACAADAGSRFVLAGWNRRAVPVAGDLVARTPADVLVFAGLSG